MKKQVIVALALFIGSMSFAQKNELKDAEKAIKNGNFADAKSAITQAEALIANADEKIKAKFYYLKGQAYYANGTAANADMDISIKSFNMVETIEGKNGKYSDDVMTTKNAMLSNVLNAANTALEQKKYSASSDNFEKAYMMSPKDTLYLYYAASTAVSAQDYEKSLGYYLKLSELKFNGYETEYTAINKETNVVETFDSKTLRDISMKSGDYIKPEDKRSGSKRGEIVKNIALIYVNNGDNEKAIEAMKDARKANPDDLGLLLSEANIHLQMGDKESFKMLIEEATRKDPDNAELQYNLGVIAADAGDVETAKKYYNKALVLNPKYSDAHNNMAVLILQDEQALIEEMNGLGSSSADNKRYDELKNKRLEIYTAAVPYLESTIKINPENLQAAKTLMNIYSALGETDKFKAMKEKVDMLEAGKQE